MIGHDAMSNTAAARTARWGPRGAARFSCTSRSVDRGGYDNNRFSVVAGKVITLGSGQIQGAGRIDE